MAIGAWARPVGLALLLVGAATALPASAEGPSAFGLCTGAEPRPCRPDRRFWDMSPLVLDLAAGDEPAARTAAGSPRPSPSVVRNRSIAVGAGAVVLTPILGYFTWWSVEERVPFNFANEGWFDPDTYAGGADKANHIVGGYIAQHALDWAFRQVGQPPESARWWALATVALTGAIIEVGDGLTRYGASWEDEASNMIGAGFALFVTAKGLDDTIGMRMGQVNYEIPPPCCRAAGYGSDYSKWVHSLDLKLAGFLPRIGVKPGPARFFLVSLTYGTKGYRFSPPEVRERNLGIDLGVSLPEILRAVGVRDDTWWGKPLLAFFTYVRIPYTAFGWRYDFNSRRWHGPDTGDKFDPGLVIYD